MAGDRPVISRNRIAPIYKILFNQLLDNLENLMKTHIFALITVFISGLAFAESPDLPKTKVIPFKELGPSSGLPLNLTVPHNYIWLNKFVQLGGIVVLCASQDEQKVSETGDFSQAANAVITIRPSGSDYYDKQRKAFSFEQSMESQIKTMGGKNLVLNKKEVRGVPVAAVTFEVGDRKLYSLAFAADTAVIRLSYNARTQSRDYDDKVWLSLVSGL